MLVDFGIAKIYDQHLKTTVGARAITPGYSPQEQYGTGKTDSRTDIYALGASTYHLLTGKLPVESVQRSMGVELENMRVGNPEISPSILSVYLGFNTPLKDSVNHCYSTMFFDGGISSQRELADYHHTDFSKRIFIFVDYSQVDSGLAPEGKSVGVITAMDDISDWDTLSEDLYKERKAAAAQILINRLDKFIPGVKAKIEYCEVGTPRTIRRFTLNPEGTAYGYAQIPHQTGRKRTKIQSPIRNLFFASAWAEPGHGFTGAILSGYWCAENILRKRKF